MNALLNAPLPEPSDQSTVAMAAQRANDHTARQRATTLVATLAWALLFAGTALVAWLFSTPLRESFGGAWPAWAVVFLAHLALAVGLEMVLHGRREHISWQVWLGVAALIGGLCAVGYFGFLRYDRSLMMGTPLPVLRAMLIAALETALALIFGGLVAGAQSALTEARFHASRWRKLHRKLRTVPQDADGLWDDEMRDSQQKLGRLTHEGSDAPHLRLQIARHEEYLDDLRASRPGVRFDS